MNSYSLYDDQILLLKIKFGDNKAFEALYHRYFARLLRHAYKKLQEEDLSEEIAQDVFVEIWKKRATLDIERNVTALLFAILRNKALHQLRARMIQSKHMEAYVQLHSKNNFVENAESLYENEMDKKINNIIDRLSPQCREAFTLSRHEHLSYKEIASRMGISVSTVEKHISKALIILRKEFKDHQLPILLFVSLIDLALQK